MKNNLKISTSLTLLLAFVLVPMVSSAAPDSGLEAVVNVDAEPQMVEVENGLEIDINDDASVNSEAKNQFGSSAMKVNVSGVAVISPLEVKTQDDLAVFSSNISVKDESVAKVDIESSETGASEVKVVYNHKGRFLGIIPVTVKSTTVVGSNTDDQIEVRSSLPWWSFLVSGKNYAKEALEARLRDNVVVKTNTRVNASATEKAEVIEAVIAEVEASAIVESQTSVEN